MLSACLPASAQETANRDDEDEAIEASPLETIVVVGKVSRLRPSEDVTKPVLEGRLSTLEDLLRDTPGVQIEPVFGGIDHPRFSIRGSGLQRGTQPAGRGIELRLDGLPITYADTSFDFVEFLEPLFFGEVGILRGGRGALEGGSTLGGIVDFRGRSGFVDLGGPRIDLDAAYMVTDVEFHRRDVQVEDNDDFAVAARLRDKHDAVLGWGATII